MTQDDGAVEVPRFVERGGVVSLLGYDVVVERGALARLAEIVAAAAPAHRYAIVTDTVVAPLYASRVADALGPERCAVYSIPAGEQHKTRDSWARITDEMLRDRCGRDTAVVAVGGGVVGDLAGFVAATYMRGVPVVQVPTTLLAMVDASVGGKTGVDTPAGKNLVGAFHQPAAVIADVDVLRTLPAAQIRNGFAEVIKHGIIADADYYKSSSLADLPSELGPVGADTVLGSVRIKAEIVAQDEREAGRRKVLNFGHTIGHAVETLSGYDLLHGEAIAIGMVVEARIAEYLQLAHKGFADRIESTIASAGLPTAIPTQMTHAQIIAATHGDKKVRGGKVEYALPRAIGDMAQHHGDWGIPVDDGVVEFVLTGGR